MQNFSKKKIAIAVGASLAMMAGVAQAANPAGNPLLRATKPVLVAPTSQGNANALYATTGFTGTLPATVYLAAPADSTAPTIAFSVLSTGGATTVNAANNAATTTGACVATDDVCVFAGPAGSTQINLQVPTASVNFTANANTAAQASLGFNIVTSGNEALRANPSTGALEYTADKTAATITWLPVSIVVQAPAGNAITATDSTAGTTTISAAAAQAAFNTVAPTPTVKTRATAGLVDGVVIDTKTPISGLNTGAAAAITVTTTGACAAANSPGSVDFANPTAPATGVTTSIAGNLNSVVFATPLTADWSTGDTTADAAAYSAACFNTGINDGTMPFVVAATATPANQATYTQVFVGVDGSGAKLASIPATVADGADPVLLKAEYSPDNTLKLTLSEPLAAIGHDDLREVAENVKIGSDALTAVNLNAGGSLTLASVANSGGLGTITLNSNLSTGNFYAGKTVSVTSGMSLKETNDSGYSATVPAIDNTFAFDPTGNILLSGGVQSASGAIEGPSGSVPAAASPTTVAVGPDTTCSAVTSTTDATKVALITCKFKAGKEVAFNTGKTIADLAGQIRVNVYGITGAPWNWEFFPTAAQLALNAAGDTLTVTIPTELVYAHISGPFGMNVEYMPAAATAKVLVAKTDATIAVSTGNEDVLMPLIASGLTDTLYTQSLTGTISGAKDGSLLHMYIAKWLDKDVADKVGSDTFNVTSGRFTIKDDKLAQDVALSFEDANDLADNLLEQAQKDKPGTITAWISVRRSNDAVVGTSASANSGTNVGQRYVAGEGKLWNSNPANYRANSDEFVYEVQIDSKGVITSPHVNGQLRITSKAATKHTRGLQFVDANGNLDYSAQEAGQGLVSGGKFNMIIGTDAHTDAQRANLKDTFIIAVLEQLNSNGSSSFTQLTAADPGVTNFWPFAPNLLSLAGTRTDVGTINLANIIGGPFNTTSNWQLVGIGNPDRKAAPVVANVPRWFVGLNFGGIPGSNWTEHTLKSGDMMLTMLGNKTGIVVEGTNGDTAGTLSGKTNAFAFALANDVSTPFPNMFAQIKAEDSTTGIPAGWSLVKAPAAWSTLPAEIDMIINVGAQLDATGSSQYTWVKGDASTPNVAGMPVFVYSKKGITGK